MFSADLLTISLASGEGVAGVAAVGLTGDGDSNPERTSGRDFGHSGVRIWLAVSEESESVSSEMHGMAAMTCPFEESAKINIASVPVIDLYKRVLMCQTTPAKVR